MFTNIFFILIVLWLLGYIVFPIAGSLIHILLVLAMIAILLRIIDGQ